MSMPPAPPTLQLISSASSSPAVSGAVDLRSAVSACFEQLFDAVPVGVLLVDPADRVLRANPAFCRIFGYTTQMLVGRTPTELIVPDFLRQEAAAQGRRALQGDTIEVETICRRRDGSLLDVALQRVGIRVDGDTLGQYVIYQDISARKRIEAERQACNAPGELFEEPAGQPFASIGEPRGRVMDAVRASLQVQGSVEFLLKRLANTLVPELADSCIVYLRDTFDAVRRVAVVCADPDQEELLLEQLANYPPELPRLIPPVARALETGEPQLVPEVSIGALKAVPGDREHVSVALLMGLTSLLVVPMRMEGRVLAAISLATAESARQLGADDLALAEEIADCAAQAVSLQPL